MASEKLLPCPFERGTCGRNALSIQTTPDPKGRTGVRAGWVCCHDCGTRGPLAYADEADIQEVAAYNWNDRAALSQGQDGAVGVKVKPLEWRETEAGVVSASTPFGDFGIWLSSSGRWHLAVGPGTVGLKDLRGELEEMEARAQADYEARIRSALVSHETPSGGTQPDLSITDGAQCDCPDPVYCDGTCEGELGKWAIDYSTESPILTYENCSVIQDEQAHYVMSLLRADAQSRAQEAGAEPVGCIDPWRQKYADGRTHNLSSLIKAGWAPVYTRPPHRGDWEKAIEAVAKVFYDSFVYGLSGEKPKWVEGGNSLVQDEARRHAHRALRAAAPYMVPEPVAQLGGTPDDLRNVLKAVLYHFGPDGAAKVTRDALEARTAPPNQGGGDG